MVTTLKEFDPNWEYYAPDPEISEAFQSDSIGVKLEALMPKLGDSFCFTINRFRCAESFNRCKELFTRLWLFGLTVCQIMDILSIKTVATIKRWKKKLCLPLRKPGNYSRQVQVEFMQKQIERSCDEINA